MAVLFYLHQVSGKRHCDNTRIAGVRQEKSGVYWKMSSLVFLHKPHRHLLMTYERFSHFVEGDFNHVSVLRGKEALKNRRVGVKK